MDNEQVRAELRRKVGHVFFEIGTATLERLLADSEAYAKLRAEIAEAAVVPITKQVSFAGGIPESWNDPRFETTYAKLLPCDADGNLLRLPAGEPGEAA